MIPLVVLGVATVAARLVGWTAWSSLDGWAAALRVGLSAMLVVTASAHFSSRRADLIRMVPPRLPRPDLLVTITGIAEVLIAAALLVPATAPAAAVALVALLVVVFPANLHAARDGIGIGGRAPTPLAARAAMQVAFVVTAAVAAGG